MAARTHGASITHIAGIGARRMPQDNDADGEVRRVGPDEWRRPPGITVKKRGIDGPEPAEPVWIGQPPREVDWARLDPDELAEFLRRMTPVTALRTTDMLLVRFSFENLQWVRSDAGRGALQRRKATSPAYLIADFPPQHLVEQAFPKSGPPELARKRELPGGTVVQPETPENPDSTTTAPPVSAILSQHSRLSFVVTDETIPWSLDGLLTAMSTLPLSVAPHATGRPLILIELPFELVKKSQTIKVQRRLAARGGLAVPGTVRAVARSAALSRVLDERLGRGASLAIGSASNIAKEFGVTPRLPIEIESPFPIRPPRGAEFPLPSPRAPEPTETAIELPWRLQLSPHDEGAFTHAHQPVEHDGRVELWHSRLGQRATDDAGTPTVDEKDSSARTVRAIWTRDMTAGPLAPAAPDATGTTDVPSWTKSLTTHDRRMLVDETSNWRLRRGRARWQPQPVKVDRLMLTALGGWLSSDLDVPDLPNGDYSITEWKHRATMGRDHEVKVVYAGFLFPFGHRASLVKLTERQFEDAPAGSGMTGRIAYLRQRFFIVVRDRTLTFPLSGATWQDPRSPAGSGPKQLDLAMPLSSLTILTRVTPDLNAPTQPTTPPGITGFCFVPHVDGVPYAFHVLATDREDNLVEYAGPLMFVERGLNASKASLDLIEQAYWELPVHQRRHPLRGQRVAFASSKAPDGSILDTTLATEALEFDAAVMVAGRTQDEPRFVPVLRQSDVVVPAMNALAGASTPTPMRLPQRYLEQGWTGNKTHVFLEVAGTTAALSFSGRGDRSGGFVTPNLAVTGLSGSKGPVGGPVASAMDGVMDPTAFFGGLDAAKLFGAVKISDLLKDVGLTPANMPTFVADSINEVSAFLTDVQRIIDLAGALGSRLAGGAGVPVGPTVDAAVATAVAAAKAAVADLAARLAVVQTRATAALQSLATISSVATAEPALDALAAELVQLATAIDAAVARAADAVSAAAQATAGVAPDALPAVKEAASATVAAANGVAAAVPTALLTDAAEVVRRLAQALESADQLLALAGQFLSGEALPETVNARLTWSTELAPWPAGAALFQPRPKPSQTPAAARARLDLAVDVRAPVTATGDPTATIVCSISPFSLRLLGDDPFIQLVVETLEFTLLPGRKPDVNIVLADPGMVFGGPLSFVNTLQELIPFDGFSDPPYLDVDSKGLRAGFDLALPDISIGVFTLANISLGAEARVPFIGDSLDFTFSFCTRENPFRLTVWCFGGGGFFAISVTPDRCRMLEAAFEFGAAVALDFGVASGSIECMAGVYFRLESNPDGTDDGELTGYFRIRGEVDVLGLISASIELYLELAYEPPSGKATGRATLTIEVEVLFLSTSVEISCEKKFTGSNADPTFAEVMGNPGLAVRPWDEYCDAFAPV
ncbi:hypothetical protein LL946_08025 [Knoellia locipacati]|uniref:hypothetical protein n=1 Tax=Knoellia locipacati TaxID=882824 RepID=UPI00384D1365